MKYILFSVVAVIFIVVLLLIYSSNFASKDKSSNKNTNELSVISYIDRLENNLEEILSQQVLQEK